MPNKNAYMHGHDWAQALASGRETLRHLEPLLSTARLGRYIAHYREIGSTNVVATIWASEGCTEGALVVADHQYAGRGRLGRSWHDVPGSNLMFSIVLRPIIRPDRLGLIMLAASVAVSESITLVESSFRTQIKWPNDILVNGRKVCGMLMETSTSANRLNRVDYAVVGIGLNVNQDEFPDEFASRSSSLALEAGRLIDRGPILAEILNRLERHYDRLQTDDGTAIREAYHRNLAGIGEEVEIYASGTGAPLRGLIKGIADNGALLLETGQGVQSLASGDVSFRRPLSR